jgi:hypothetical protein
MTVIYISEPGRGANARGAVFRRVFAEELPSVPFHEDVAPYPEAVHYLVNQ